ncbi:cytochrome c-type biogenesis protein CcmH [Rhodobium orientis]|uniref:C-type cytochrome biogenesis protein CcmI n=1 Tax=Rhodobium orientis TaxID=34017 RepID=A0A327JPE7_9HYPH|nr:c-type cytochrome biogenesis protein CcmI [Rhodobium orientis]MBB4303503.1 cytochrome c-type biogenesis protein CcmH [Rhodobium orientis]MBK5950435.1 c-type cytochrome biogenesis protein CcmI [Rhodobium orientis]RAI28340.1 c-type cytochrome biogenesis protein CcmI [Rhodobium orientis]
MTLWIAIGLCLALAVLWLCRPFLRRSAGVVGEADFSISVYRDQLDEVDRDEAEGRIAPAEAEAARAEIEARTLKAAKRLDPVAHVARRAPVAGTLVMLLVAGGSLGLYLLLGVPQLADQPLAERKAEVLQRRAAGGDMKAQVALLIERTKADPKDFETWWTLGRAYLALDNPTEATGALKHAVELSDDDPGVLTAYAEAVTLANGNKVSSIAEISFHKVREKRPKDPRARYYLALAKAQRQDFDGALRDWMALKAESAPGAPWLPLVRRDIANMARFLKRDLKTLMPDATEAELARAGSLSKPDEGGEDASTRIKELEKKLAAEPKDFRGWIELATLRAETGANDKALDALNAARTRYAAAPFILSQLDATARSLGLDHLESAEPAVKGPTATDIAAASEMTDETRAAMIDGMVEGLEAKLGETPDNPDGWIMLIRSYSVLKEPGRAATALEKARGHFEGNKTVLAALEETARELGIGE